MLIKSPRSNFNDKLNITLSNDNLEQVKSIRYLGVEIDEFLTWDKHIKSMTKSIGSKITLLGKLGNTLNSNFLELLYKTTIQPCFDYACSVWGNSSLSNRQILFRLQKRAAGILNMLTRVVLT